MSKVIPNLGPLVYVGNVCWASLDLGLRFPDEVGKKLIKLSLSNHRGGGVME